MEQGDTPYHEVAELVGRRRAPRVVPAAGSRLVDFVCGASHGLGVREVFGADFHLPSRVAILGLRVGDGEAFCGSGCNFVSIIIFVHPARELEM